MTYDYSATGLLRPPRRTAVGDLQQPIPGATPAIGAGTTTPLPAPPPPADPNAPALPFGNGVSPVGAELSGIAPVYSQISPPTTAPTGTPLIPQPTAPVSSADLGNTLIAPEPGQTPLSSAADAWRQKFAGELGPTDLSAGPAVNPTADPRTAQYRGLLDDSAAGLATTDRRSMLNSLLSDFDTQSLQGDDRLMTLAGRRAASLGRLGMGNTAQDINQIARGGLADRQRFRNALAADTIDKEIGDRFSKTGLFADLAGRAYGEGAADRGELRGERGWQYNVGRDNQAARRAALGDSFEYGQRYAGMDYGQGQDYRNELRGERGYQDSRDAYATDRRIQEAQLQDQLTGSAFNRNLSRYQTGTAGNPSSVYGAAAGDYQDQSNQTLQALMQYLQSLGVGRGSV